MRSLILLLLCAAAGSAQPFGFGVKLGLPLTDFISTVESGNFTANSNTNRYIVGVTGELRLPFGLGIEADVLYRHFSYNFLGLTAPTVQTGTTATSSAWEFPILVKYKFPMKIVRPYVDGGVAWDRLSGLSASVSTLTPITGVGSHTTTTTSTSSPSELANSTTMGAVFGVGLDVHVLLIHVSPELRFTRWTDQHFNAANILHSNQNQAEFLLGITF